MVNTTPNPIKEYYIAYFDILGYKEFFNQQPERVPELLNTIHDAVRRTNAHIGIVNQSPLMRDVGSIDIQIQIFSDNILLCLKVSDGPVEPVRVLAFLQIVADVQRGFVAEYGLFVRGGIKKGPLSFNDDYVFGHGLIDVVAMEERAQFPRIVIAPDLLDFLQQNHFYTQEEYQKAVEIEKKLNNKESVSPEEKAFYSQILFQTQMFWITQKAVLFLTFQWPDGNWILCYLNQANASTLFGEAAKSSLMQLLQTTSPSDFQLLSLPVQDFDAVLKLHKTRVEEQLCKYGSNSDIATGDTKAAELREKILHKYIWVMAFHNFICDFYQKPEHKILTRCNCDARFLKMTIEVLNDETGIQAN